MDTPPFLGSRLSFNPAIRFLLCTTTAERYVLDHLACLSRGAGAKSAKNAPRTPSKAGERTGGELTKRPQPSRCSITARADTDDV